MAFRDPRLVGGAVLLITGIVVLVALPSATPPKPGEALPTATPAPAVTPSPTASPIPPPTPTPSPQATVEPVPFPSDGGVVYPCGEADPECATALLQSRLGVPFTSMMDCGAALGCVLSYDVFWPPEGDNLPTVVMIPGGPAPPGNRVSMWPLARYVAARGAVVFVADYRASRTYGGGLPRTFADVGCAIATAAAETGAVGGSAGRVTLVSHSFGGFPAAVVATQRTPPAVSECLAGAGRRPDAAVGIAGVYLPDHLGSDFVKDFVGDTQDVGAVDARDLATTTAGDTIPVTLIVGTADLVGRMEHADDLRAALGASGYEVSVLSVQEATHETILSDPATVDAVLAVAR